ncbi:acyl-CoA dehydrogenase family protein [Ruegeria marisrubri]|uniref:acyl-CoA dehydrogenase family protein n=1 Tax=Ruegeria marisrubri TaxID=1685379 RepID=UPI001CD46719|nr:acyl-CoA dehydrogenase family protein [Ruegeria marisrubri]MCA0906795.1 acyl-CoA dehydrogenase family protein [Ruegeria marisrubri]
MDFAPSPRATEMHDRLKAFMQAHIYPRIRDHKEEIEAGNFPVSFMEDLKSLARAEGLWNMFLPSLRDDEPGTRLSNLDYAPLAELMGQVSWSSEVFNCNAPDTGNMELLHMFATPEQREDWLVPLLNGKIRSAFAMTEPDVASSDATNITTSIRREGDEYVINGRKWFITNACHPNTRLFIVMGKTDPNADRHKQQSMIIVPRNTPGLEIVRNPTILNMHDPEGHAELVFKDVRVPVGNLLGEEGSGFALAQARLGPGRIHHCMRSIGAAEMALNLMVERAQERKTFGKQLSEQGVIREWIAKSRLEIEQARLLTLKAAWKIDQVGAKKAFREISLIKVVAPQVHAKVTDRAMQVFGAMGMTPDTPLADSYTWARALRYADGPDEVHLQAIAKQELKNSNYGMSAQLLTPPLR